MSKIVSIITVNYNGEKFLSDFFTSVCDLDYPEKKMEIIMVDNASTDGSVEFVKKNFPEVKIIKSEKNLGFGGGNNLGMRNARGKFFLLVNNDTVLKKDALKNLMVCYKKWSRKEKVGAVNAKLVLFDKYVPLMVKGARFVDYELPPQALPKSKDQFLFVHGREKLYWEEIYLPFKHSHKGSLRIDLLLRNAGVRSFEIKLGRKILKGKLNIKREPRKIELNLTARELTTFSRDCIQNAGSVLFRDGFGRDRGTMVSDKKQYYEIDKGQYDKDEPIQAFCGAGVLLNKKALEDVGYFDENFFMYYEDSDLSLRLAKSDWQIVYCPKALVRHIHAGSSKEWSPFFIFQVERNRLLLVSKHWPRQVALNQWFSYFLRETLGFLYLYYRHRKENYWDRFKLRLRVNLSLARPFLINLLRADRLSKESFRGWW